MSAGSMCSIVQIGDPIAISGGGDEGVMECGVICGECGIIDGVQRSEGRMEDMVELMILMVEE